MQYNTLSQTVPQPVHGPIAWWQADYEPQPDGKARQKSNLMNATINQAQEVNSTSLNSPQSVQPLHTENATAPTATSDNSAGHDLVVGGLWCLGGIIVTAVTYNAVKESGGHYIIAWGAILFGGIQFLKGLFRLAD